MRKLLIAIDSPIITDILKCALESEFTVYTCRRGDEAFRLLEDIRPEAMIIHLSLSKLTGLEVLRKTSFTPPAVLALTYFLSDAVVRDAAAAGAGDILLLPSSLSYILSRLNRLLYGQ